MSRLPTVGADDGNWGSVLNDYLGVEHDTDGQHVLGAGLVTENVNTVEASGTAQTLPAPDVATIHYITLTDNCEITMPTAVAGQSLALIVKQDGAGGRTVSWSGAIYWPSSQEPVLTTTAGKMDVLTFMCVDGSNWLGFLSGQDMGASIIPV